jgi:MFS family permease
VSAASPEAISRATPASLWRRRDFMLLWSGQTVAESGSAVAPFALPFLAVTVLRATPFDVGVLTALGTVSFLLIALPAGVIVDRVARRRLMMWCNVGRAAVIGTVPVAYWLGRVTLVQLYAVALATGVLTVFFDVAYQSYLPTLLSRDQLVDGNGKIGTTQSAAQMLGLPVAGGMVSLFGLGNFGMYFSAVVYNIAQTSYRQAICPPALLGRMNASVRWIAWGTIPLGALAGGSLATWIGVRETLWIAGAGVWAAGLLVFCSPLRGRRDVEIESGADRHVQQGAARGQGDRHSAAAGALRA